MNNRITFSTKIARLQVQDNSQVVMVAHSLELTNSINLVRMKNKNCFVE